MGRRKSVVRQGEERLDVTPKEKAFLQYLLEGKSKAEAYRLAYNKKKPTTYDSGAARKILSRPAVRAELERIRSMSKVDLLLATPAAVRNMRDLASGSKSEDVRFKANKFIIDSGTEREKTGNVNIFNILSPSQIASAIRETIEDSRQDDDNVIDIQAEG